jgi:hypothetical protein
MYLLPYLLPIFQNDAVAPSMKVSEAWTNGYTGNGVIVAILDDGLQGCFFKFPSLAIFFPILIV